jgi:hypothetical protein
VYRVDFAGACSTVITVSATEELTVLSIDTKGITRSNSANKAFDNATCECASVVSIAGAPPLTASIPLGEPYFGRGGGKKSLARRTSTPMFSLNPPVAWKS